MEVPRILLIVNALLRGWVHSAADAGCSGFLQLRNAMAESSLTDCIKLTLPQLSLLLGQTLERNRKLYQAWSWFSPQGSSPISLPTHRWWQWRSAPFHRASWHQDDIPRWHSGLALFDATEKISLSAHVKYSLMDLQNQSEYRDAIKKTNPGHKNYELNYSPETSIYLKWWKQWKIMGKPLEMQFCRVMSLVWLSTDEKWRPRRRVVRKLICPFFLLPHHRYLNTQTLVRKSKDFSPQQPYPQMALKLSLLFWEGYHKRKKI